MTETTAGSRRRSALVLAVLVLAVWASRTVLPGDIKYAPLDRSWCMGLAHALLERWRTGVDVVFTFGPLGCLSTGLHLPEIFWIKILLWEGAFQLLAAVVLVAAGLGIGQRWLRVAYFVAILLQPLDPDAHAFLTIAAAFVWITREGKPPALAIGSAVLAGLALVKFTYTFAVLACVVLSLVMLWGSGARRAAGILLVGFLAVATVLWWACGQSLTDLPAYVARSVEISSGYSAAMSVPGAPWARPIAAAVLGAALVAIVLHGRRRVPVVLFHAAAFWIAYKAGFVRASDHAATFFQFALAAPFLLVGAPALARGTGALLAVVGLCVSAGPDYPPQPADPFRRIAAHARALLRPQEYFSGLESLVAGDRRGAYLPRTRQVVGHGTVDVIPFQQLLVFRNHLEWSPRPVFQGYACLTAGLQELNARFLESDRAPEFVLFHLEAIDHRLPTMDDAGALQIVARDYEPVLQEKGYLLLRRNPRPAPREGRAVSLAREIAFGEWIDLRGLEGSCHLLALDVRATLAGRLRTSLDAAPALHAEIELGDGEVFPFRIVPGMLESGVIIDPLLRSQGDWLAWCAGRPVARPARFRVLPSPSPWMYEPRIALRLLRADDVVPRAHPDLDRRLMLSILPTQPVELSSSRAPERAMFQGEEVLQLSPTARMTLELRPGRRRLTGRFGCRSAACAFQAVLARPGAADEVLLELRPDRRLEAFHVVFEAGAEARLVLSSKAESEIDGDASCWAMIEVE